MTIIHFCGKKNNLGGRCCRVDHQKCWMAWKKKNNVASTFSRNTFTLKRIAGFTSQALWAAIGSTPAVVTRRRGSSLEGWTLTRQVLPASATVPTYWQHLSQCSALTNSLKWPELRSQCQVLLPHHDSLQQLHHYSHHHHTAVQREQIPSSIRAVGDPRPFHVSCKASICLTHQLTSDACCFSKYQWRVRCACRQKKDSSNTLLISQPLSNVVTVMKRKRLLQ